MSKDFRIDPLASFETKKTNEYGLSVARLIASEWFNNQTLLKGVDCQYHNRRDYIRAKRQFVRGEVDVTKFKNRLSKTDTDLKYLNLDFRYVNIAEKFSRIVSNGISDEYYILDIRSTDKVTVKLKKDKESEYRRFMENKQLLESTKKNFGIDLAEGKEIPQSEDELNMWLETKDRPKIEITEEILIDFVKQTNDWDDIEMKRNKDLVDIGIAVCRVFIDIHDGVKIEYVDPENYIHSFVTTNNFKDKYYEGCVEQITLSDLKRESGLTDDVLRKLAKQYASNNKTLLGYDWDYGSIDDILGHKVAVLRYSYKTSKTIKYKTKKRNGEIVKASKKNDDYIAPNRSDVGMIEGTFDTWFEGNYVIGTDTVYGWKECENIYDDIMNKATSPFVTYATDLEKNKLRSFLDNIEKPSDELNFISLKIQHLTSELKPDLTVVNKDALAKISEGDDAKAWNDAIDLIGARGIVVEQTVSLGDDGGEQRVTAAKPYAVTQGSSITILLNEWAHWYNVIRENTGINPARDGMMAQDSLVGVNNQAQVASNTVTKHIQDTSIRMNTKIAELISTRLHLIYNYSEAKKLRDLYNNVVGKHLFDHLEVMRNRHLHEFGFTFRVLPTSEQIVKFREDLTLALNTQQITVDVKIEAESMFRTNPKLAQQFLSYSIRKANKQRVSEQMLLAQEKSKNDAMAAQAKVQADAQAAEFKAQVDIKVYGQKALIDVEKHKALAQINQPIEERKYMAQAEIEQIKNNSKFTLEDYKETRKDDRTKLQATQQSKMIDQRQNENKEPIDFENEFNFNDPTI